MIQTLATVYPVYDLLQSQGNRTMIQDRLVSEKEACGQGTESFDNQGEDYSFDMKRQDVFICERCYV